ncbi:MAG: polysaccharide deacetylase family protein [bacterium]
MAYDEHWASANPGPIAGYKRYTSGLQYLLTQVPKEKISVALGNYGYDRATGHNLSSTKTFQEVITTMKESSGTITFDTDSLNPMTEYYDTANVYHQIRYLDAITFFNQVEIGQNLGINNFSLWRLGSEDPSLRDLLSTKSIEQNESPTELASFDAGYSIDYEGNGELYKILSTPQKGSRTLQFDTGSNLIRDEQINQFPVPYTIGRFGSFQTGKVVLSFDDGPDQKWTPQVLAILKKYNIPAVFFVIGEKAELYPNIIQQERDQGNVIGNHTFTHPNIALISTERMDGEINMTQRLLESTIGRSTVLFRPPYAEDIEPEIPDQALPLVKTTNLGYITVGMKVDPGDRRNP